MAKKNTGGTMKVKLFALAVGKVEELSLRRGATVAELLEKSGNEGEDLANVRVDNKEVRLTSILKPGQTVVIAAPVSGGR